MVYLVDCEGAEYLLQILDGECCQSQFQKLLVWSFGKEQWARKCKTNNYLRPGNVGKELKEDNFFVSTVARCREEEATKVVP